MLCSPLDPPCHQYWVQTSLHRLTSAAMYQLQMQRSSVWDQYISSMKCSLLLHVYAWWAWALYSVSGMHIYYVDVHVVHAPYMWLRCHMTARLVDDVMVNQSILVCEASSQCDASSQCLLVSVGVPVFQRRNASLYALSQLLWRWKGSLRGEILVAEFIICAGRTTLCQICMTRL